MTDAFLRSQGDKTYTSLSPSESSVNGYIRQRSHLLVVAKESLETFHHRRWTTSHGVSVNHDVIRRFSVQTDAAVGRYRLFDA